MKTFRDNPPIGKTQHSVSFHGGTKFHKDGSPFFDLQTFRRHADKNAFVRSLEQTGHTAA
jgi:hypothetical protein